MGFSYFVHVNRVSPNLGPASRAQFSKSWSFSKSTSFITEKKIRHQGDSNSCSFFSKNWEQGLCPLQLGSFTNTHVLNWISVWQLFFSSISKLMSLVLLEIRPPFFGPKTSKFWSTENLGSGHFSHTKVKLCHSPVLHRWFCIFVRKIPVKHWCVSAH